jgi:hypothetical protein
MLVQLLRCLSDLEVTGEKERERNTMHYHGIVSHSLQAAGADMFCSLHARMGSKK